MNKRRFVLLTGIAAIIGFGGFFCKDCRYLPKEKKERIEKYSMMLDLSPNGIRDAYLIDENRDGTKDRIKIIDENGLENIYFIPQH